MNELQISMVEDQLVWGNLHPDIWETILSFDTVPISDTTGVGPSGVRKPKTKFPVLYLGLEPSIVVEYKNKKRKKKSIFQFQTGTKSLN